MVIGGGQLRRWMAVALLRLPARAGGIEATFAKGPIASDDRFASARTAANLLPGDGTPVLCLRRPFCSYRRSSTPDLPRLGDGLAPATRSWRTHDRSANGRRLSRPTREGTL